MASSIQHCSPSGSNCLKQLDRWEWLLKKYPKADVSKIPSSLIPYFNDMEVLVRESDESILAILREAFEKLGDEDPFEKEIRDYFVGVFEAQEVILRTRGAFIEELDKLVELAWPKGRGSGFLSDEEEG